MCQMVDDGACLNDQRRRFLTRLIGCLVRKIQASLNRGSRRERGCREFPRTELFFRSSVR